MLGLELGADPVRLLEILGLTGPFPGGDPLLDPAHERGFEPRRPLARVAQSVERVLGKDEVTGSIPVASLKRKSGVE